MKKEQLVRHEFEPVYDKNSEILILGSFPSAEVERTGLLLWASTEPFLEGVSCHCTGEDTGFH